MRLFEIENWPESKLDIDNKVYIVYDETGKEISRHAFQHVWDSSPAKRAAEAEVRELRIKLGAARREKDKQAAEAKPLSDLEKEYIEINRKWQRYFDAMYSKDTSKRVNGLDDESVQVYNDQMDKWMKRMEQLGRSVRKSVINGTYKPPA